MSIQIFGHNSPIQQRVASSSETINCIQYVKEQIVEGMV